MRTWILNTVLALAFLITANTNLQAQFDFEFCGSTFTVNCDGTVNVDLAENVFIYKVWDGGNLIAEWNNFTPAPDVVYTPFVGGQPPFGNPVMPGQNVYLDVQTEDCGQFILNISRVIEDHCPPDDPTSFTFCGSTFHVNCDGTVDVDLETNVFIYKVWDGPNLIVELNNFTGPPVIYFPFVGGQPPFGNPVLPGQNVYLDVQTEDCGQFILNISQVLSENCPGYLIGDFDDSEFVNAPNNAGVEDLNVYPNPAIDQVTISLPIIDDNYRLQLLDLNGSVLRQQSISGGNQQLDLQGLPSGTYLLSAQSGDEVYTKRIVKN
ncbi:MAG: T9SS type A sorting domain-containing protein [Bacteroidota bacterium]